MIRTSDRDYVHTIARASLLALSAIGWMAATGVCVAAQDIPPAGNTVSGSQQESDKAAEKFSQGPAPAWVVPVKAPAPVGSADPETVRLADVQIRINQAGEDSEFDHHMLTANNTAGVTALGQLTIDFNPSYQSVVLHSLRVLRGDTVIDKQPGIKPRFLEREPGLENSIYTGMVTIAIVIDDLRVGDTVDYSYTTAGANPVFKGVVASGRAWQTVSPTQLRRVSIDMPASRKIEYRFMGATHVADRVKPAVTHRDGYEELVFEQRDIPPFRSEGAYPPGFQSETWLQYSEYTDWNQMARWAADLFEAPAPTGPEFKDLVTRLRAVPDPGRRAAQALDFVQSEIRYTSISLGESSHRPYAPDEVLLRRYGDCKDKTLLLVSLYKALGLEARPVVLGMSVRRGLNDWLPAPTPFDHAIVQLRLDGNTYWLDPTAQQKPKTIKTLGHLHGGDDTLVADTHVDRLTTIEVPHPELYSITEHVHLDGFDEPTTLDRTVVYSGAMAEDARWSVSQTAPEEFKKGILGVIQRRYGVAQWNRDPVIVDDTDTNTVTLRESFTLSTYAEHTESGAWILRHDPTMAFFFKLPDMPQRTAPYGIAYPAKIHYVHEVELPPGVTVTEDDVVHEVKDPYFTMRQVQKRKGQIATTEYDFESLAQSVPAGEMSRFLTDLRTVQNDFHPTMYFAGAQVARTSGPGGPSGPNDLAGIQSAAAAGDASAQSKLGMLYIKGGQGVTRDLPKALSLLQKAAGQNLAEAQYNLGRMYYEGVGTLQDYDTALVWELKAARQEHPAAQYLVGSMYAKGQGVPPDSKQALEWYRKSAAKGNAAAENDLGFIYETGRDGVPKDLTTAVSWYRKASEHGLAMSQARLGGLYVSGTGVPVDYAEAAKWLRKAADQNNAAAENAVGWLYENGYGGLEKDPTLAVQWYRKSADQSNGTAEANLGRMIFRGMGAPKDRSVAIGLWEKASGQGEYVADFMLGMVSESGDGAPRDFSRAATRYQRAADRGYAPAENRLGVLYLNAWGVPHDLVEAHKWFNLASAQGEPSAAQNRDKAASQMTAEQIQEAQKRAKAWQPPDPNNPVPAAVESDCADGQQLCRDGSFLCGVYRRDFIAHGRICPGVTDGVAAATKE